MKIQNRRNAAVRKGEEGIVILVAAIVLLFVVAAIAALAIDLVTFYAARSQAQLAADSAALAGARVLANSGTTSNPSDNGLFLSARGLAQSFATQVATSNAIGGRNLTAAEVVVTPPGAAGTDLRISVQVTRTDLPTFFARIWGRTTAAVSVTATAEAYNPSGLNTIAGQAPPVAPVCVKPWILPNQSPKGGAIFDQNTGQIEDLTLLGWGDGGNSFFARCRTCVSPFPVPNAWQYYPMANDAVTYPAPLQGLADCNIVLNNDYQRSIAGCVSTPVNCNSDVNIDTLAHNTRNSDTAVAVNCLTNAVNNKGDQVDDTPPNRSFQFLGGDDNPIVSARNKDVLVSDSVVTVPVFDSSAGNVTNPVHIIGFVQLFLNSDGNSTPTGGPTRGHIKTTIVNLVGCGRNATGTPVVGNGASAVPVRLITPP